MWDLSSFFHVDVIAVNFPLSPTFPALPWFWHALFSLTFVPRYSVISFVILL
jgi:hypothetical protein